MSYLRRVHIWNYISIFTVWRICSLFFSTSNEMHELMWTETRPPAFNLPISALQNSCCGWAGWQLHPSTTSSMPAPSKRSTQSTRHALRSWDMAMMTLTTPPLDKHSGTTSDPVAQQSESGRWSAAWGWMRGWSSEMSSAELKERPLWKETFS